VNSDFGYTYDHDVVDCSQCHLIDDYFQDGPCPECGHTFTDMGTTYGEGADGRNWKTFWCFCDRCRVAQSVYAGTSAFSYDETGPGSDLSGYRIAQ